MSLMSFVWQDQRSKIVTQHFEHKPFQIYLIFICNIIKLRIYTAGHFQLLITMIFAIIISSSAIFFFTSSEMVLSYHEL